MTSPAETRPFVGFIFTTWRKSPILSATIMVSSLIVKDLGWGPASSNSLNHKWYDWLNPEILNIKEIELA